MPSWQYGYRSHGYWEDEVRLGFVGRPPGIGAKFYTWMVDVHPKQEGTSRTLKEAKKIVERAISGRPEDVNKFIEQSKMPVGAWR